MVTEPIQPGEIYTDRKGRHYAKVIAVNNDVVLMCHEGKRSRDRREFNLPRWFLSSLACGWRRWGQ